MPSVYPVLNNFKTGNFTAGLHSFPCSTPPFMGSSWGRKHCSVHVPFSLTNLSQTEKSLGSFSSDPDNYLKEFKSLTQSCDLTWHDVYIILSPTLLPEEKEGVWQASQAHADEIHRTDDTKGPRLPHPGDDPNWDYQAGRPGGAAHNLMIACLIVCLQKAGHKVVNFD